MPQPGTNEPSTSFPDFNKHVHVTLSLSPKKSIPTITNPPDKISLFYSSISTTFSKHHTTGS
jgi:hypothetical protein